MLGEVGLREADGGPGCGDGARDECGGAEGAEDEAVECREGVVVEVAQARDGEDGIGEEEEAREGRERAQPEGEVGAETGGIAGVEGRAGKGVYEGVGG